MRYLVRFSVEVEIESDAQNDLGVTIDAIKCCLKEERAQCVDTKVKPIHVEPKEGDRTSEF